MEFIESIIKIIVSKIWTEGKFQAIQKIELGDDRRDMIEQLGYTIMKAQPTDDFIPTYPENSCYEIALFFKDNTRQVWLLEGDSLVSEDGPLFEKVIGPNPIEVLKPLFKNYPVEHREINSLSTS